MDKLTETTEVPRIIYIERLSEIIGKTATTIRTCATNDRYKHLIPRPFKLPHSRRLAWYEKDVLAWLAAAQTVQPPSRPRRGRPTKIDQIKRKQLQETESLAR